MVDAPVKIGMRPPHPGTFIREEILDELGLSVARMAEVLKVRRATLSDLLNGKAALSPEMALRVENDGLVTQEGLIHIAVPARRWYEDVVFT